MSRRTFHIQALTINGKQINQVIVDDHAADKHPDVTDDIVLDLVRLLDGVEQAPDDTKEPYEYFATLLTLGAKRYRLVWLLERDQLYIGVITAYRDKRRR